MGDALRMDYINSLPQPFIARLCGEKEALWEVYDIGVDVGLCRILVGGMIQCVWFSEIMELIDADGVKHDPDDWWAE